jgi:hypothetical protein
MVLLNPKLINVNDALQYIAVIRYFYKISLITLDTFFCLIPLAGLHIQDVLIFDEALLLDTQNSRLTLSAPSLLFLGSKTMEDLFSFGAVLVSGVND